MSSWLPSVGDVFPSILSLELALQRSAVNGGYVLRSLRLTPSISVYGCSHRQSGAVEGVPCALSLHVLHASSPSDKRVKIVHATSQEHSCDEEVRREGRAAAEEIGRARIEELRREKEEEDEAKEEETEGKEGEAEDSEDAMGGGGSSAPEEEASEVVTERSVQPQPAVKTGKAAKASSFPTKSSLQPAVDTLLENDAVFFPTTDQAFPSAVALVVHLYATAQQSGHSLRRIGASCTATRSRMACTRGDSRRYKENRCLVVVVGEEHDGSWKVVESVLEHNHEPALSWSKEQKATSEGKGDHDAANEGGSASYLLAFPGPSTSSNPFAAASPATSSTSFTATPSLSAAPPTPISHSALSFLPHAPPPLLSPLSATPTSPQLPPPSPPTPLSASPSAFLADKSPPPATGFSTLKFTSNDAAFLFNPRTAARASPDRLPSFLPPTPFASSAPPHAHPLLPKHLPTLPSLSALPPLPPSAPTTHLLPFLTSHFPSSPHSDTLKLASALLSVGVSTLSDVIDLGKRDRAALSLWVQECRKSGMGAGTCLMLVEVLSWAKGQEGWR